MRRPIVSVILPVYNGENYLRFAIESVLSQTFKDFELIVVDDGSKDSTPEVARCYGERVRYVRQENTGVAGAFNHGLRLAAGRYISWLSHDDVFHEAKLEKQVEVLERHHGPAVCYTDVQMIDSRGEVVSELILPEHDRTEVIRHVLTCGVICIAAYSVMYDRRCIDEVGMYSETWRYTQDVEMLLRFARRFPLVRVAGTLIQVREHETRGVRSKKFEHEVTRYYREQLRGTPLEDLFPELASGATRAERARARLWIAEQFALGRYPLYRFAFPQFLRAMRAYPRHSLLRIFWLLRHYANDMKLKRLSGAK